MKLAAVEPFAAVPANDDDLVDLAAESIQEEKQTVIKIDTEMSEEALAEDSSEKAPHGVVRLEDYFTKGGGAGFQRSVAKAANSPTSHLSISLKRYRSVQRHISTVELPGDLFQVKI